MRGFEKNYRTTNENICYQFKKSEILKENSVTNLYSYSQITYEVYCMVKDKHQLIRCCRKSQENAKPNLST